MKLLSLLLLLLVGIAVFSHATAHGTNSSLVIGMKNKNSTNLIGTSSNSTVKPKDLKSSKSNAVKSPTLEKPFLRWRETCKDFIKKVNALIFTKNIKEAAKLFDQTFVFQVQSAVADDDHSGDMSADQLIKKWMDTPNFFLGIDQYSKKTYGDVVLKLAIFGCGPYVTSVKFMFNIPQMKFTSGVETYSMEKYCSTIPDLKIHCKKSLPMIEEMEIIIREKQRNDFQKYIQPTSTFTVCQDIWNAGEAISKLMYFPRSSNIRIGLYYLEVENGVYMYQFFLLGLFKNFIKLDVEFEIATNKIETCSTNYCMFQTDVPDF